MNNDLERDRLMSDASYRVFTNRVDATIKDYAERITRQLPILSKFDVRHMRQDAHKLHRLCVLRESIHHGMDEMLARKQYANII